MGRIDWQERGRLLDSGWKATTEGTEENCERAQAHLRNCNLRWEGGTE